MYETVVILPTYREKNSLQECIESFISLNYVSLVIVVNNNAEKGTSEVVPKSNRVIEIFEPNQGYGSAIKCGLRYLTEISANYDFVAICEPDGTFIPNDLGKLISFTDGAEMVIGSRTVSTFIWSGANMGRFLRWGNWLWAKIIEVFFNTSYLSDVGCTFRIMERKLALEFNTNEDLLSDKSTYGVEMMLWCVALKKKVIQVPVNYLPRKGISSVTGNLFIAFILGIQMLNKILVRRFFGAGRWRYE